MAGVKGRLSEPIPKHRILREIYRHYTEFKALVSESGESIFEHGYWIYPESGGRYKIHITISFWDLYDALNRLSDRKREAVLYNVIKDMKQKDVAKLMGITTVSVGQYVEQAMLQLADYYFAEDQIEMEPDEKTRRTSKHGNRTRTKVHG